MFIYQSTYFNYVRIIAKIQEINALFNKVYDIVYFREESNRLYHQERHAKQDREELVRERLRNNIREKYGISKKADSSQEGKDIKVKIAAS